MKKHKLGRTNIEVSEICLGSMTWGSQNTESEAHEQIDFALDNEVDFIDTAELYPTTPLRPETQGRTEEIIGSWVKNSGRRDDVVIATKVTGNGIKWIRDGAGFSPDAINDAVDGSLKRLATDRIDLYQLHWPNRGSYHFANYWTYNPQAQDCSTVRDDLEACLEALDALVRSGKVRAIGLSNETCWGTTRFLQIAEARGFERVASIQNEYSLMRRIYDTDLAELSHHEDVGLLAYTPLAAGLLSGKYLDGAAPKGSRGAIIPNLHGRLSPDSLEVVRKYVDIANAHGLDPAQMALAYCLTKPFMTSVIIGATTMDQLRSNIGAASVTLSDDVISAIEKVHRSHALPY